MNVLDLIRADPNVASKFRDALVDPVAAQIRQQAHDEIWAPTRLALWRERSRERLRAELPHAEWDALLLSLEAIYEALSQQREFSWACGKRERIAALDWCVSRAFRK